MALHWLGDELRRKVEQATIEGMTETMAEAVTRAKQLVPVKTATLQGSLQFRQVERDAHGFVGRWGSFDVNYAADVELGTGPHEIRPKNKQALYWPGAEHPVKVVRHPGTRARPYLRPAADEAYPGLVERIRRRLG